MSAAVNKEGGGNVGSLALKLEEQHNLTGSVAGSCSILGVALVPPGLPGSFKPVEKYEKF